LNTTVINKGSTGLAECLLNISVFELSVFELKPHVPVWIWHLTLIKILNFFISSWLTYRFILGPGSVW